MNPSDELSFLDIFDAIPDVMGLQDTERRILMYNEAGYRYLGLTPEQAIGRRCYELIGRDQPCETCATEGAVRTGKPTNIVKYVPENGTWLNIRAYPIKNAEGKVYRVVEHLRDITESKALQTELERLNKHLEAQVDARTRELQNTVEDLTATRDQLIEAEKLSALGRLVAGFSHEINTPLGVAVTSASFVRDQMDMHGFGENSENRPEHLPDDLVDNINQGLGLMNRNLSRARDLISGFKLIAADRTSEQQRIIYPYEYLKDLVLSLYHEWKSKDVNITLLGDEGVGISTYPGAIAQVVTNLTMNSILHAYPAGEHGEITIDVAAKPQGGAVITYADDGCGMDERTLKHLYEPFFSSRMGSDGIGLGMNIVYNLMKKQLGGTISCDSSPGNGTRYFLHLPDLPEEIPEI